MRFSRRVILLFLISLSLSSQNSKQTFIYDGEDNRYKGTFILKPVRPIAIGMEELDGASKGLIKGEALLCTWSTRLNEGRLLDGKPVRQIVLDCGGRKFGVTSIYHEP